MISVVVLGPDTQHTARSVPTTSELFFLALTAALGYKSVVTFLLRSGWGIFGNRANLQLRHRTCTYADRACKEIVGISTRLIGGANEEQAGECGTLPVLAVGA